MGERVLMEGQLGGKCAPDDTFWVLDDDDSDGAEEGSKVLVWFETCLFQTFGLSKSF